MPKPKMLVSASIDVACASAIWAFAKKHERPVATLIRCLAVPAVQEAIVTHWATPSPHSDDPQDHATP